MTAQGISQGIVSGINGGGGAAPGGGDPAGIFGASLSTWFKADEGVTESSGVVSEWANQASAGNATQTVPSAKPVYVAAGIDGTPELNFTFKFMYVSLPIATEFTVYAFLDQGVDPVRSILWDGSRGIYPGGLFAHQPSIFNGSWHNSTDSNLGWHLNRFSVRINTSGNATIAVDDLTEQGFALTAIHSGSWSEMGRSVQTSHATLKQLLIVDEYVDDVDSRNDDILSYFKSEFPTLASW